MITFSAAIETPVQPRIPEWKREERYMYCDQTDTDQHSEGILGVYEKIKQIFS